MIHPDPDSYLWTPTPGQMRSRQLFAVKFQISDFRDDKDRADIDDVVWYCLFYSFTFPISNISAPAFDNNYPASSN